MFGTLVALVNVKFQEWLEQSKPDVQDLEAVLYLAPVIHLGKMLAEFCLKHVWVLSLKSIQEQLLESRKVSLHNTFHFDWCELWLFIDELCLCKDLLETVRYLDLHIFGELFSVKLKSFLSDFIFRSWWDSDSAELDLLDLPLF